jgi:hypothetical protein
MEQGECKEEQGREKNFSSKGKCKGDEGRKEMRLGRGFSRLRTEKNEGAQVKKKREGAMLPEIGFIGGATITCAPNFDVSLICGLTSHGWNKKVVN